MATVPIYKLTGSVNDYNSPVIRAYANTPGNLTNRNAKIFQLFRGDGASGGTSVFVVNADGSIDCSGSINTNAGNNINTNGNITTEGYITAGGYISATGDIISSANINAGGRITAKSFSGSISGSRGVFYRLTSSNAKISNANISLPSTAAKNALIYNTGTNITTANQLIYKPTPAGVSVLYFTGSSYLNSFQIEGGYTNQSNVFPANYRESSIVVSVDNNKISRGYAGGVGPENLQMRVIASGSAFLTMDPRSFNFSNQTRTQKSTSALAQDMFHNILQIQDNTFYFWPTQYSYSTVGRGAALGIGVLPGPILSSSACKAALHINVFSASTDAMGTGAWSGTATSVQNRQTAILVTYGSGSLGSPFVPKFYVSSSGNTYTAGGIYVNTYISCSGNIRNAPLATDGPVYSKGGILTNVNPVSDSRLKDEIQSITYGLNEISSLNPVTYYWKNDITPKKRFGFIAQEVQPYIPELVGQDTNGYYNLNTFDLIPILVNAIKELKSEVDALKLKLP